MPVYFVVYLTISDPEQFMEYYKAVLPVIERWGGRIVAKGEPQILEGSLSFHQAVIFQWPSRQTLLDYWDSDEYAKIKKLREGASKWDAVMVDSI